MMTSGNKSVIVLGMHRSRTSLAAKILMELGVFMGHAFRKPDESNPYGYWEDLAWRNINKTILNASGHTWWNPPASDFECLGAYVLRDVRGMANALTQLRKDYPIWGFKDPRTILTVKWLLGVWPDPHYVIVRRDKSKVIESLSIRAAYRGYRRSAAEWSGIYDAYYDHLNAFLSSGNNLNVHTIESDDILVDGHMQGIYRQAEFLEQEVRRLADFIGVLPPNDIQEFMERASGNKLIGSDL